MNEPYHDMKQRVEQTLAVPGSHGFDHTLRVISLCEIIGKKEQAQMEILLPAAIFHDVARPVEKITGKTHEEEGAKIAESYLKEVHYPAELIWPVMHAIRAHNSPAVLFTVSF